MARPLLLAATLAACSDSSSAPAPSSELTSTNTGLAAEAVLGAGELVLVLVREAEQGGRDLNGDGDASDRIVHVAEPATGRTWSTALALGDDDDPLALWACEGARAAFGVSERAQGGLDRNGDGDAEDRVLVVLVDGRVSSHPWALRSVFVGGALVACALDEAAQGGSDLDFDGDADGTVLALLDLADGSELLFSLRDSRPLAIADGRVALRLAEREGVDLNGDGDGDDTAIFEVLDGATRLLQNTTLVLASDAVASAGGTFGVSVSEAGQGGGDLTGDGDEDDAAFFVYSPARGFSVNLGLSVPLWPPPVVDGERYLLLGREAARREDLNADGDLDDWTVGIFEARAGLLHETGLASQGAAALLAGWVAVSVSEAMQGSSDLDGDGEAGGNVVHVQELASGRRFSLGVDAFRFEAEGERLWLVAEERALREDGNGDGDRDDRLLFEWNAATERLQGVGSAAGELLAVRGGRALFVVGEAELGEDRTGDGDIDDRVVGLLDVDRGRWRPLDLALGSVARLQASGTLLLFEDESSSGVDSNGDGDALDEVLYLVH